MRKKIGSIFLLVFFGGMFAFNTLVRDAKAAPCVSTNTCTTGSGQKRQICESPYTNEVYQCCLGDVGAACPGLTPLNVFFQCADAPYQSATLTPGNCGVITCSGKRYEICNTQGGTSNSVYGCNGNTIVQAYCDNPPNYNQERCISGVDCTTQIQTYPEQCSGYQLKEYNNDCYKNSATCNKTCSNGACVSCPEPTYSWRYVPPLNSGETTNYCGLCPFNTNNCSSKITSDVTVSANCDVASTMRMANNVTVNAGSIRILIKEGSTLEINSGKTLTVNGYFFMERNATLKIAVGGKITLGPNGQIWLASGVGQPKSSGATIQIAH